MIQNGRLQAPAGIVMAGCLIEVWGAYPYAVRIGHLVFLLSREDSLYWNVWRLSVRLARHVGQFVFLPFP
jgi:hypothetical protein